MVSERVSEIDGWGKLICSLVGVLGRFPSTGEALGMLFLFGSAVAHRAAPTPPPVYSSLAFSRAPSSGTILGSVGSSCGSAYGIALVRPLSSGCSL